MTITSRGLRLHTPITQIGSFGAQRQAAFSRLGIETISDLLRHLPVRYEPQWAECPINKLQTGVVSSTRGLIIATRVVPGASRTFHRGRRPKSRFEVTIEDDTGRLVISWFNALFLRDKLHPGQSVRVQGKVSRYRGKPQLVNPQWEQLDPLDPAPLRPHRLCPVYRATEQLPSGLIERLMAQVLPESLALLIDPLSDDLLRSHAMVSLAEAFGMAHQPRDEQQADAARRRLAFNELLLLQLGIAIKRKYNQLRLCAPALRWNKAIDRHIRQRFPFRLTDAQERVILEMTGDLQNTLPMNRLVQGDVGSGKTVLALYALLLAVANRKQGALMAPTELLAEQHYLSISSMLKGSNVRMALLSGGQSAAGSSQRQAMLAKIRQGQYDIVIGTQALTIQAVTFHDLAVVVIDEQHRFGVLQRAAFRTRPATDKQEPGQALASPLEKQRTPHYLVMTATPIPRTLSLTVFGDLDVSVIDQMPPGRTPITSRVVGPEKAEQVYRHIAQRVERGEQAYVVVPAIDEQGPDDQSRTGPSLAGAGQLKSVRAHARMLAERYFRGHSVEVIHGRLKPQTRKSMMDRFRAGKINVLVATTVIEVGVDVPNATAMVVEHADRFGLAQLHQLRGRIGRGDHGKKSVCVFIAQPGTDEAAKRLKAIAATSDGFKIAEHDLAIRGMGDFFGTRQAGVVPLRVARLPDDMPLLHLARRDAQTMIDADPTLSDPSHRLLRQLIVQQYGDALGLIDVG